MDMDCSFILYLIRIWVYMCVLYLYLLHLTEALVSAALQRKYVFYIQFAVQLIGAELLLAGCDGSAVSS